ESMYLDIVWSLRRVKAPAPHILRHANDGHARRGVGADANALAQRVFIWPQPLRHRLGYDHLVRRRRSVDGERWTSQNSRAHRRKEFRRRRLQRELTELAHAVDPRHEQTLTPRTREWNREGPRRILDLGDSLSRGKQLAAERHLMR